jgi:DNA-binding response OmpR family regulator/archaellum biogenesis ATPase FlaH
MAPESATLIPTGIEPIDSALGGLDPGRAHLVYGDAETGKTALAMRFLVEGLRRGETCALVVRYAPETAVRVIDSLGYDCRADLRAGRLAIFEYATDLVDQLAYADGLVPVLDELASLLGDLRPRRIAFDTADFIFSIQVGYGFPLQIPAFTSFLAGTGAVSLLVVEERVRDRIVQSFRASAPTVIHTSTRRFGERTEFHMAFEKSVLKAPPRRYGLGPDGFVTLEVYGANSRTLPLPTSPARRRAPGDRTGQLVVPDEAARLVAEAAGETPPESVPTSAPAPAQRSGRPRVLVVDEDRISCGLVLRVLGPECDVGVEPDGISALARLSTFDPDLVVLELGLPIVDGLAVCRQIREISAVPIVAVSASRVSADDRVASAEAGADLFMAKPLDLRELGLRARQLVARFRGLPPPVGAALLAETGDPLVTYDQFVTRLDIPQGARTLVGCRLDSVGATDTIRVVDLVRSELRAEDLVTYDARRRAVVALVAADVAGDLAAVLVRRVREHLRIGLDFWTAPVENADGVTVLDERLDAPAPAEA